MPKPKFCLKCHANHSRECWEYWQKVALLYKDKAEIYLEAYKGEVRDKDNWLKQIKSLSDKEILIKKLQRKISQLQRSWWRCW